jgi:3-oxoacyl-[acyl-carrier protein] reductase
MTSLLGKVAIVTGGASGIGLATASRFAREGASVVIADIDVDRGGTAAGTLQAEGLDVSFVRVDVSDSTSVQELVAATVERYGEISVLFNNAAYLELETFGSVGDTTEEAWRRCLDVTLTGVYLCTRAVLDSMIRKRSGSIINNASVAGLIGVPGRAAYSAAKAGVMQLTRSTATEYGENGIRCNAICPGLISTAKIEAQLTDDGFRAMALESTLLKRTGSPDEVANTVLFLASDESSYITGTVLIVDGGRMAH